MLKIPRIVGRSKFRFLLGFVTFQALTSPRAFACKMQEWARVRGKHGFESILKWLADLAPGHGLLRYGHYKEFRVSFQRMSPLRKLLNLPLLIGAQREEYLLRLSPLSLHKISSSKQRHGMGGRRILLLATSSLPYTRSGYTVRTHETAKALLSRGIEVLVVTRYGYPITIGSNPSSDVVEIEGVKYLSVVPSRFHLQASDQVSFMVNRIAEIAASIDADVILTTTDFHNAIVAQRVAVKQDIPWAYEVRGKLEDTWLSKLPPSRQDEAKGSDRYKWSRHQEMIYSRSADAVISLGAPMTDWLVKTGVSKDRIYEIPNAIPQKALQRTLSRKSLRHDLGLPEGKLIGTVTSVVSYEGLDILLEVASIDPSLSVVIVGDGEDLPRLKVMAKELGIDTRVYFVGRQPSESIWDWYAAMDVFVLPRLDVEVCRTVTPLKPLGAMAVGTPIVASDLPAIRYITGNLSVYIDERDPRKYHQAIDALLQDPPNPERSISWAEQHTWEKNAEIYEGMIRNISTYSECRSECNSRSKKL